MRAFIQEARVLRPTSLPWRLNTTNPPIQNLHKLSRSRFDKQTLGPCSEAYMFRPVFHRVVSSNSNVSGGSSDSTEKEILRNTTETWAHECQPRLEATGINVTNMSGGQRSSDPFWNHAAVLRRACLFGFLQNFPIVMEIEARLLCATIQDTRYPIIYRSLEQQAQILYVLGRVELERDPKFHRLAWYTLSIAAGLGQLDAALLLHQLEKIKSQYACQNEQRAIIAKAAMAKLDWRAMVAYCEHTISKAQGRSGRGRLQKHELDECSALLSEAMAMTSPATQPQAQRESPPEHHIDAETLETFDQPYKVLISLTNSELAAGNYSDEVTALYELATHTGALTYQDPEAAWLYAHWQLANSRPYTDDWVRSASIAARDGNADACFQLAVYHLKKDGWIPTVTEVVLKAMRKQWQEDVEKRTMAGDSSHDIEPLSDEQKHSAIMEQKNGKLMAAREGLEWMKIAAQLHVDSATKMLNRYCIVAGLLRQNGFLAEGKQALLEAEEKLRDCVGDPKEISQAIHVLRDHLDHWDVRLIQEQLRPEDINKLLDLPI